MTGADIFFVSMMITMYVFIKEIFFAVLYYGYFQARKDVLKASEKGNEIKSSENAIVAVIPTDVVTKTDAKNEELEELIVRLRLADYTQSIELLPIPYAESNVLYTICDWARFIHTQRIFDFVSFGCVIANSFTLMVFHYGMNDNLKSSLNACNLVFLLFYIFEMVLF